MIDLQARLSKDLTLVEALCTSHRAFLAEQLSPPLSVLANLQRHAQELWQPVRDLIRVPMRVSSGYRCWDLNRAVGGSMTSMHPQGLATDNVPLGLHIAEVMSMIVANIDMLPIDQVIFEYGHWIHLGSPQPGQPPRRIAEMKFTGMVGYLPWDPKDKRVV